MRFNPGKNSGRPVIFESKTHFDMKYCFFLSKFEHFLSRIKHFLYQKLSDLILKTMGKKETLIEIEGEKSHQLRINASHYDINIPHSDI